MPDSIRSKGETDERLQNYGFKSNYFLIQEILFLTVTLLTLIAFAVLILAVARKCVREDKQADFKKRMKLKFKWGMMRLILEFSVPVFVSLTFNA